MLWEQGKIKDRLKVNSGKDYKHLSNGNIPVYGTSGYMLSVNKSLSNKNGIGIGRKGTIDKPQFLNAPFWTVDTLFYLTLKQKDNLSFFYFLTQKINWKKYDESTGVPSLSKATINSIKINVPNIDEQYKISHLLNALDNLITLYENKQRLMKAMFKEVSAYLFNFSREKNVLKKALTSIIISETKGSAKENMLQNGSLEYLDTNRLNGGKPKLVSGKKDVSCKDIIILWDGSKAGTIYYGFSGILGSTLKVFKLSKEVNSEYVYFYLKLNQELIFHKYRTPNIPHVSKDFSKRFSLSLPKKELQDLIANTLHSLNLEITLIDSKISKLKEVKKELLQNMFI